MYLSLSSLVQVCLCPSYPSMLVSEALAILWVWKRDVWSKHHSYSQLFKWLTYNKWIFPVAYKEKEQQVDKTWLDNERFTNCPSIHDFKLFQHGDCTQKSVTFHCFLRMALWGASAPEPSFFCCVPEGCGSSWELMNSMLGSVWAELEGPLEMEKRLVKLDDLSGPSNSHVLPAGTCRLAEGDNFHP